MSSKRPLLFTASAMRSADMQYNASTSGWLLSYSGISNGRRVRLCHGRPPSKRTSLSTPAAWPYSVSKRATVMLLSMRSPEGATHATTVSSTRLSPVRVKTSLRTITPLPTCSRLLQAHNNKLAANAASGTTSHLTLLPVITPAKILYLHLTTKRIALFFFHFNALRLAFP